MMELNMKELIAFIQKRLIEQSGVIIKESDIETILDCELEYLTINGFTEPLIDIEE